MNELPESQGQEVAEWANYKAAQMERLFSVLLLSTTTEKTDRPTGLSDPGQPQSRGGLVRSGRHYKCFHTREAEASL